MNKNKIRLLRADEIECRISTINEKGITLLLYKDARVDQKILDETYSPFGWKRTHQSIDGNLYCTVEIYDSDKQMWIAKQDVGISSYSEKEKGQASDSFKRACFNWGIGRELYSAPFIWISANKINIQKKNEKYVSYDKFSVQYISYNEHREIESLIIVNENMQVLFEFQRKNMKVLCENEQNQLSNEELLMLKTELIRTGVDIESVLRRYKLKNQEQMTKEIYEKAMNCLKKTKDKNAA